MAIVEEIVADKYRDGDIKNVTGVLAEDAALELKVTEAPEAVAPGIVAVTAGEGEAEGVVATVAPVPKEEEAAGEKSAFKTSQLLAQLIPVFVMCGMHKVDLVELGYIRHVEVLFVLVQVLCLALLGWMYSKINTQAEAEEGELVRLRPVKGISGKVNTPARYLSAKAYDLEQAQEQATMTVIAFLLLGVVYWYCRAQVVLVLQLVMTPLQMVEAPLFQLYGLGRPQPRPFPKQSLSFMGGAEPEEEEEEAEEEVTEPEVQAEAPAVTEAGAEGAPIAGASRPAEEGFDLIEKLGYYFERGFVYLGGSGLQAEVAAPVPATAPTAAVNEETKKEK